MSDVSKQQKRSVVSARHPSKKQSDGRPPGPGHWGEEVTAEEMADYIWLRPEIEAEIKFAEGPQSALH